MASEVPMDSDIQIEVKEYIAKQIDAIDNLLINAYGTVLKSKVKREMYVMKSYDLLEMEEMLLAKNLYSNLWSVLDYCCTIIYCWYNNRIPNPEEGRELKLQFPCYFKFDTDPEKWEMDKLVQLLTKPKKKPPKNQKPKKKQPSSEEPPSEEPPSEEPPSEEPPSEKPPSEEPPSEEPPSEEPPSEEPPSEEPPSEKPPSEEQPSEEPPSEEPPSEEPPSEEPPSEKPPSEEPPSEEPPSEEPPSEKPPSEEQPSEEPPSEEPPSEEPPSEEPPSEKPPSEEPPSEEPPSEKHSSKKLEKLKGIFYEVQRCADDQTKPRPDLYLLQFLRNELTHRSIQLFHFKEDCVPTYATIRVPETPWDGKSRENTENYIEKSLIDINQGCFEVVKQCRDTLLSKLGLDLGRPDLQRRFKEKFQLKTDGENFTFKADTLNLVSVPKKMLHFGCYGLVGDFKKTLDLIRKTSKE